MSEQSGAEPISSWIKEGSFGKTVRFGRSFDQEGIHVHETKTLNSIIGPKAFDFKRVETDEGGVSRSFDGLPDGSMDLEGATAITATIPVIGDTKPQVDVKVYKLGEYVSLTQRIVLEATPLGNIFSGILTGYSRDGELRYVSIQVGAPFQYTEDFQQRVDEAYSMSRVEQLYKLHDIYQNDFDYKKRNHKPEDVEASKRLLADENSMVTRNQFMLQVQEVFVDYPPEKIDEIVDNVMYDAAILATTHRAFGKDEAGHGSLDRAIDNLLQGVYLDYEEKLDRPTTYGINLEIDEKTGEWGLIIDEDRETEDDSNIETPPIVQQQIKLGEQQQYEDIVFTLSYFEGKYRLDLSKFKMGDKGEPIKIDLPETIEAEAIRNGMQNEDFAQFRNSLKSLDIRYNDKPLVTAA